jgi:propionyl-CoA synthetase
VHSVVFGGFAPKELAKRIEDSKCRFVIAASCGLEPKGPVAYKPLVDGALGHSKHKPEGLLFLRRHTIQGHEPPVVNPKGAAGVRELDWDEEIKLVRDGVDGRHKCWSCIPVASEEPVYTLYTSVSTLAAIWSCHLTLGAALARQERPRVQLASLVDTRWRCATASSTRSA